MFLELVININLNRWELLRRYQRVFMSGKIRVLRIVEGEWWVSPNRSGGAVSLRVL